MPEVRFIVQWPDASISDCYSPSTVVHEYLQAGQRYTLADFIGRSHTALNLASDRVRLKYGYACSSAIDQLHQLEQHAARFDGVADASVLVVSLRP